MGARGEDESAFKLPPSWEGPVGKAKVANRTREIRPCGMTRGACGNVDHGGTRHPPCISKEQVLETLHLKLCAPQFYPDCRREGEQSGHYRGLRAGHVFIGVTRELGRATYLLAHMPGLGDRTTKSPGVVGGFHLTTSP